MEYHGDRFEDASLIIYSEDHPVAVFPAEKDVQTVHSHRGLTYAGWILIKGLSLKDIQEIIENTKAFYHNQGIERLEIRMVPDFFAKESQEDLKIAIQRAGGESIFTAIHHFTELPFKVRNKGKKWGKNKAIKAGLKIEISNNFGPYWDDILIPNLRERHRVSPTHSLLDIKYLAKTFSDNIKLFIVKHEEELLAGAVVFETATTAHLQYVAANQKGRNSKALDYMMSFLIEEEFFHKSFFNMGVSHVPEAGMINQGLVNWKESFGGRPLEINTFQIFIDRDIVHDLKA
ncbi:hypothetical protein EF405_12160 [Cyclobacteriaceae bacterium YHN15]|nr:hypothetical protein EF405_12160 [Cyclobacteriaceae bacterium YHN15]